MGEQAFGAEAANALLRAGVGVKNAHGCNANENGVNGTFAPYHLPKGTTLTSEQVTAAVQADPGRLAARLTNGGGTFGWITGGWQIWRKTFKRFDYVFAASPVNHDGPWKLVYRPDLEHTPEQPPSPAQGTTLRAIMEWCAKSQKGALCRRMPWCSEIGDCHIDGDGDLETDEIWLSAEDVYEATDWQASTDDGETWFVPGKAEPREGPELWAWMCRTGRTVESLVRGAWFVDRHGVLWVVEPGDCPRRTHYFPATPCVPADGCGWDEGDHA